AARQLESGDRVRAAEHARAALQFDGNCVYAHSVLAHIALDGEHYQTMLGRVHGHLRPRTYLEIGVETGATLRLAHPETLATGVAWKVIVCLKKYRPELEIHTLACPPTGLSVVRGLDPSSRKLESQLQALYQEFIGLPYSVLGESKSAALNLVPGDWDTARA